MKQNSPSIGIVVCAREHGRMFTSLPYIQAAADHGGLPFLIPFYEDMELSYFRACLKKYDGFLFCGGADINPLLFGPRNLEQPIMTLTGSSLTFLPFF